LPVQELEAKIELLAAYKDKEIIVYCSRSHRSPMASYIITQNGFKGNQYGWGYECDKG